MNNKEIEKFKEMEARMSIAKEIKSQINKVERIITVLEGEHGEISFKLTFSENGSTIYCGKKGDGFVINNVTRPEYYQAQMFKEILSQLNKKFEEI